MEIMNKLRGFDWNEIDLNFVEDWLLLKFFNPR